VTDQLDEQKAENTANGDKLDTPSGVSLFASETVGADGAAVFTARGTEDGLVLRIDGRADWSLIISDIEHFLGGRRKFFEGGDVSIEWLDRLPTKEQCDELENHLKENYKINLVTRNKRRPQLKKIAGENSLNVKSISESDSPATLTSGRNAASFSTLVTGELRARGANPPKRSSSQSQSANDHGKLLDQLEIEDSPAAGRKYMNRIAQILGEELDFEEDANAKVIFGTLRSGQKIETPFSLVVIGDVNPGADLIAGGDIIVLGSLRGTAHAGAYDDDSFDRVIISLQMRPMQLRIGSVISRGSDDVVRGVEVARIDNRRIIVEAYNPRANIGRKIKY
jgi:septum site-determining protein MinC